MKNEKSMIELFSGKKTVSNFFKSKGWKVTSVDNNPKLNPSICGDILTLDLSVLPVGCKFIWASPVCTFFSREASADNWKKETLKYRIYKYTPISEGAKQSILMLSKTIDIINSIPGVLFVLENPVGRFHHSELIKNLGHYRYFVNYADFGYPYSKETYLFTNFLLPFGTKKHKVSAPQMNTVRNVAQRSSVPALLVETIYKYIP